MNEVNALSTRANKLYALGNYDEAVEIYAQASEKLEELRGPDDPGNADVMLLYGRTLVKVALKKSEVLGGGALPSQPNKDEGQAESRPPQDRFSFDGDEAAQEEIDDEFEDEVGASAEEEFQNAWEVLDLARILFRKKLEDATEEQQKTDIKMRLAETFDLLGEVSLENENFDQAVDDLRAALTLKQELHDSDASQVSGAHYMLALALEYCTSLPSRKEAATEVQHAITGFESRLKKSNEADEKYKEEKEMLAELKLKLSELQSSGDNGIGAVKDIFDGEGSALKDSLIQAMQSSNDLTTLVRKKEKKRHAEAGSIQEEVDHSAKKVKVGDAADISDTKVGSISSDIQ